MNVAIFIPTEGPGFVSYVTQPSPLKWNISRVERMGMCDFQRKEICFTRVAWDNDGHPVYQENPCAMVQ